MATTGGPTMRATIVGLSTGLGSISADLSRYPRPGHPFYLSRAPRPRRQMVLMNAQDTPLKVKEIIKVKT